MTSSDNVGDVDQVEGEIILTYEVSDEALEAAAGNQWECTATVSGDDGGATSACGKGEHCC